MCQQSPLGSGITDQTYLQNRTFLFASHTNSQCTNIIVRIPESLVANRRRLYNWISVLRSSAVETAAQAPLVLITGNIGGTIYTFRGWKISERRYYIYFAVEHWVRKQFKTLVANDVKTTYILSIAPLYGEDPYKCKRKITPPHRLRKNGVGRPQTPK